MASSTEPSGQVAASDVTKSQPCIAFVSGPIDTGDESEYFYEHYASRIDVAIENGDEFVIGPIPTGVDSDALHYILEQGVPSSRITVYVTPREAEVCGAQFRNLGVHVFTVQDALTTWDRDAAMTQKSDYDILRWRPKAESKAFYGKNYREGYLTNTERNWRRRRGIPLDAPVDENDVAELFQETAVAGNRAKRVKPRKSLKDKLLNFMRIGS